MSGCQVVSLGNVYAENTVVKSALIKRGANDYTNSIVVVKGADLIVREEIPTNKRRNIEGREQRRNGVLIVM